MTKLEKLKQGLKCCNAETFSCGKCPYDNTNLFDNKCLKDLLKDCEEEINKTDKRR